MTKVSIIMPVYNAGKYVKEAINSVLKQTFKNWELIIVNDGSTDKTGEMLKLFRSHSKVKILFNRKRKGVSISRNKGIKNAKGKYIAFIDADDLYEPNKLERQVKFLDKHPEVDMIYTDMWDIDKNGKILEANIKPQFNYESFLKYDFIPNGTVMIKKSVLDKVGLFDKKLKVAEDYDLWLRVADKHKIKKINFKSYRRRLHKGQHSKWFLFKTGKIKRRPKKEKALKKIYEKWKDRMKKLPK